MQSWFGRSGRYSIDTQSPRNETKRNVAERKRMLVSSRLVISNGAQPTILSTTPQTTFTTHTTITHTKRQHNMHTNHALASALALVLVSAFALALVWARVTRNEHDFRHRFVAVSPNLKLGVCGSAASFLPSFLPSNIPSFLCHLVLL